MSNSAAPKHARLRLLPVTKWHSLTGKPLDREPLQLIGNLSSPSLALFPSPDLSTQAAPTRLTTMETPGVVVREGRDLLADD